MAIVPSPRTMGLGFYSLDARGGRDASARLQHPCGSALAIELC